MLTIMLAVLNGMEGSEDPYTPSKVIQSLIAQGWVISHGEQDAHELFHVMTTTLEEEVQQPLPKVQQLSYLIPLFQVKLSFVMCVC
jgi:ubiquitin carboxyl-terminal hydrolase 30